MRFYELANQNNTKINQHLAELILFRDPIFIGVLMLYENPEVACKWICLYK